MFDMMRPIMDAVLVCGSHPNHRVSLRTFTFWRSFVNRLAPSKKSIALGVSSTLPPGEYSNIVQQTLVHVCRQVIQSAGFPANFESLDPDDREHFFDFFRNDVRDVLRHFVSKIPTMADAIFRVSVDITEKGAVHNIWQSCEAGFHAMSAVSKWAAPGHPTISHLIAMCLNDPRIQCMHNIAGLRCTIVMMLGQLANFIRDTNPSAFGATITFIVQSLSFSREHDMYPMRVGQDHCGVVAFDKICSSAGACMAAGTGGGGDDNAMFKELASNVWGKQMLSNVGVNQAALSDRDLGWFLGGLAKLASAMQPTHGIAAMRMLLDPIMAAADETTLCDTERTCVREFVADSTSRAMQSYRPHHGTTDLVVVIEGYSGLISLLLRPRDKDYDDRCHGVICEGISSVYDYCGYRTGTRLLSCFGEVILQCLNGPRPLACHVETLQRCLVSLAKKSNRTPLTTEEVAKQRDMDTTRAAVGVGGGGGGGEGGRVSGGAAVSSSASALASASMSTSDGFSDVSQAEKEIYQTQLAAIITSCVESSLKFLYGCGSLNSHPDLVASMFVLLRDTCRHITGLFINMWQNGPIVEFTTAGLTMQKRECGRAVLGFIEVLTTCGLLDASRGPTILHGMVGAAAGNMPSFMLEPISDSLQFVLATVGRETMMVWLTQAVSPAGFPTKSTKDTTKQKFIVDFTGADNRSKFKRVLKAFVGGKRKGENGVGFGSGKAKSKRN